MPLINKMIGKDAEAAKTSTVTCLLPVKPLSGFVSVSSRGTAGSCCFLRRQPLVIPTCLMNSYVCGSLCVCVRSCMLELAQLVSFHVYTLAFFAVFEARSGK